MSTRVAPLLTHVTRRSRISSPRHAGRRLSCYAGASEPGGGMAENAHKRALSGYFSRMKSTRREREIAAFGQWFEARLTDLGYDLSRRGGGRGRFAADSGVSPATVSRILLRQSIPAAHVLAQMAPTLREPLGSLLVLASLATEEEVRAAAAPPPTDHPLTPEQAAARLGIKGTQAVELFVAYTRALQDQAARRADDRRQEH